MAVAAFKSTTKRSCNIGGGNPADGSYMPSEPDTPTRGRHRRSRSFSDFSSRYFSDSGSLAESSYSHLDSIFNKARASTRHQSSDSESDADSVYSRYTARSRSSAVSEYGGSARYRAQTGNTKGTRQGGLRRSSSNLTESSLSGLRRSSSSRDLSRDHSDSPLEPYYRRGYRHGDDQASRDHPEEEKTIRAVHTQKKRPSRSLDLSCNPTSEAWWSFQSWEPSARELDAITLYDAMRAEMRKAVSDIRNEIEQSMSKEVVVPSSPFPGGLQITIPGSSAADGADSTVADIRREYAAKLEQSEKRAQELWSQLAVEERRCLDLVKVVKELVPGQPASRSKPQPRAPPPPSKPFMGPDVEKQLVSKSLDEDAQRFFEECISGLDPMSANDTLSTSFGKKEMQSPTWSLKDMSFSPQKRDMVRTSEKKTLVLEPLISFCAQIEQTGRCTGKSKTTFFQKTILNDDGLVLPWLQWETDLEFLPQEYHVKDKDEEEDIIATFTAGTSRALTSPTSSVRRDSRQRSKEKQDSQSLDLSLGVSGLGCLSNGESSCWKSVDFGYMKNVAVSSIYERGRDDGRVDVEKFVLQRMWLRQRIKQGRILVCGGMR
ncbi:hypothetical protein MPTK1_2g21730 [Marchantia polymorpha subsp. ruderalis]|uniref:Uncharacterized protein n=1 Tax=Marchantia polymorpha TaxID=3197 RepID=A0A2R6X2M3_MARPO|nr:hypothetical protein MARPO_0040s0042 [Marchantia polymorpha]BBN03217.1 hypothetical protein Mp_2g21730 [Marchantia polymorpha subsp. ruderalis]|eukprot:PTQ40360.1 hypothetical protein MARPO_0040s0042 [Marchantia polymorpha]